MHTIEAVLPVSFIRENKGVLIFCSSCIHSRTISSIKSIQLKFNMIIDEVQVTRHFKTSISVKFS